jgi:hypothetical protein
MSNKSRKKNRADSSRGSYFFAYQSKEKSGNCDNVDAIQSVAKTMGQKATTWESMKTNGKLINKQILAEIDKAETFACDLSYLNANVFFELGYAIGKRKHLFVMLNTSIKDAAQNYANINILKNIGYSDFKNAADLARKIESSIDKKSILLDQLEALPKEKQNSIDVFYIKSSNNSQAEMDTLSFIKNSAYTQICDDTSEIAYQPLEWYLDALNSCKCLIVHLSGYDKTSSTMDNAKNSLYAGLGHALGKKVLLVAPKPYYAPIDYSDLLFDYNSADECVSFISEWLPKKKKQTKTVSEEDKELNLLKLGIGYSIAEDEKTDLLAYFIETHAYTQALKSRSSIFYGRKGTGKTALYIKLYDEFSQYENTYLVGLKPESTELIENINAAVSYQDAATKRGLFHSVWKYVIYSKLILDINAEIRSKKKIEYTEIENKLISFKKENHELLQQNFMSALKYMTEKSKHDESPTKQIIEIYNSGMLSLIKEYFKQSKYYKIAILADNLDKAWDAESDLSLQSDMILCLLEVSGKLQQDLIDKTDKKVDITVVVFLRLDIYNFIMNSSREPDKLTISSHEVEWNNYRELLKKLVEKRIIHILEMDEKEDISGIWKDYFDLGRDDPFEKVQNACLPRPRDILFFFGKMFESACNHSHLKVNHIDYDYALDNYTNFLYQNLVAEMSAEYPYIRKMIVELQSRFVDKIEINKFRDLVKTYEPSENKARQLISELFLNEYIVATDNVHNERYITYEEALKADENNKGRFRFFTRKYVYIVQHPRYAKVKL